MTAATYITDLLRRTASTFWQVAKIMVPVMIAVRIADEFGVSHYIGRALAPVMGLIGLPGEAGLVWAVALLTGFYGGIGALVALVGTVELTALQLNVLLSIILFAHAIPVEQAIAKAAGASFWLTTFARIVTALVFGALLFHIGYLTGSLQEPATLGLMPVPPAQSGWAAFALSTVNALLFMAVVLLALLAVLDGLKAIGVFDKLTGWLTPFFARLGIVPALAPLVTIGMLLGLTYGGGLIIGETRKRKFTKRELFTPLAGLSIIHALIEDTLVTIALGGDVWVMVLWRTLFALLAIAVIAGIVRVWPQKGVAAKPHSL